MKPVKIIMADDHKLFIDGIKAIFSKNPELEIIGEAYNGIAAMQAVHSECPDVLLTDIHMPGVNGIELTCEVKAAFPEIKVLGLSMLKESIYIRRLMDAGASGYVLKSVRKKDLIEGIKTIAGGKEYFSPEVKNLLPGICKSAGTRRNNRSSSILTDREREVLSYIARGYTDKEIAEMIYLSSSTIITHRKNMLSKLGLKNKVELAHFAIENRLHE